MTSLNQGLSSLSPFGVGRGENLVLSNELIKVELPPLKISSVSHSSDRIGESWGCSLCESVEELCHWWKYGHMNL